MKAPLTIMVVSITALCVPAAAQDTSDDPHAWHLSDRPFRVAVTLEKLPRTGLVGDDIAVVVFPAAEPLARDGRGIRVGVAGGGLTPHRVLQVGPGDQVRVAFALRGGGKRYYVYFGKADAEPAGTDLALTIRRGVLMESYPYGRQKITAFEAAREFMDKPAQRLGCDFRPNIFLGHNPFGPQNTFRSRFTGYLNVPRDSQYTLIISSRDASFLFVDDRPMIANGGWHPPQRDYSKQATLALAAGLHEVEMLHFTGNAAPVIVLAWQPDPGRRAQPVPPVAFAEVARPEVGPIEQRGRPVGADFTVRNAGRAEAGPAQEYHRIVFSERLAEQGVAAASLTWDFGDGQTATGAVVEHVYLLAGTYRVKLTAQTPDGPMSRVHRVAVSRDWDRPRQPPDNAVVYGRMVRQYDFAALSDRALAAATVLFEDLREDALVLDLARLVAERDDGDATAQTHVLQAAARICRRQRRSDEAAALLTRAIEGSRNPVIATSLRIVLGELTLTDLNDPDAALTIFEQIATSPAARAVPGLAHQAHIGLGDTWRRKGDYARARAAYLAAMPSFPGPADEALRRGVLGRDVEAFLRGGEYDRAADTLRAWEFQLPVDRLTGQTALLWTQLHAAQRQWERVVVVAEALVKVNPDSAYAPQLLLQASDAYLKLGQPATATGTLRRIVEHYPESALAQEVRLGLRSGRQ